MVDKQLTITEAAVPGFELKVGFWLRTLYIKNTHATYDLYYSLDEGRTYFTIAAGKSNSISSDETSKNDDGKIHTKSIYLYGSTTLCTCDLRWTNWS